MGRKGTLMFTFILGGVSCIIAGILSEGWYTNLLLCRVTNSHHIRYQFDFCTSIFLKEFEQICENKVYPWNKITIFDGDITCLIKTVLVHISCDYAREKIIISTWPQEKLKYYCFIPLTIHLSAPRISLNDDV